MHTQSQRSNIWLKMAETIGRWAIGEKAVIVSARRANRLTLLEKGYRQWLREAQLRGNNALLDEETKRSQLTSEDLARLAEHAVPAEQWPDDQVPFYSDAPDPQPDDQKR